MYTTIVAKRRQSAHDSDELRRRRAQLGLTQAQLGELFGVTKNTIARWERGEMTVTAWGATDLALSMLEAARSYDADARLAQALWRFVYIKSVNGAPYIENERDLLDGWWRGRFRGYLGVMLGLRYGIAPQL